MSEHKACAWFSTNYYLVRPDLDSIWLGGCRSNHDESWSITLNHMDHDFRFEPETYVTQAEAQAAVEAYWTTPRLMKLRMLG